MRGADEETTMRTRTRIFAVTLLVGLLGTAGGCFLLAAGAATGAGVAYAKGDIERIVNADSARVVAAAQKALGDLGFSDVHVEDKEDGQRVAARTSNDKEIHLFVAPRGDNVSKIWVRVGTFGEKGLSESIYERIQANL
jgi:hypothetical protein